ncbi:stage V sporulation protein B [Clostridium tyrobutyricum]|jgi:stage V sporulation protein B|uniref:Multidrug-efflux transporter n=1 Tax=Clostridium tyrobutyricum DIVETGP TaxID=1408889 RepID=W6N2G6_CLOTY|nr:stage V sporulation protein B [Clostridium tyrobutyricum]AND84995.1 SpoVB-like membrane protein [Clostridium tyrobutyricum]ANP69560.1 stage V sporulation protein B [Clostridium tyrobutyricum]MBR9648483.1 stage V sporulation protein B [Clostridium tyrobutyricum]MBV4414822.1 stage V sporulation protein B [Clostridium tyrobutyricum]MBV4423422.1 stage V sporulation protein B [Clostridium tyrobutyricum]
MKRDRFLKSSLILICSNLITSIFAFIFSIILSRYLGAEGMGLYDLIMPIYDLFICLICGGMVTSISKASAVYFGKDDFSNLDGSISVSLLFDSVWSLIIICFVFVNAKYIGMNIIDDIRAVHAIQVICPAMFFIALSCIFKGYFYGTSDVKIPALIDVVEKFLRIIIITNIVSAFTLKGVNKTVTAAYLTLAFGELISLVTLYFFYRLKRGKYLKSLDYNVDKFQLLFNVLIVSFPLCLNGFLSTGISAVSGLTIPRRLVSSGIDYNLALSMIGRFKAMAFSIVFFPTTILNSISIVLIPDLSEKISSRDYFAVENRISQVLKVSIILGIITMVVCLCIPDYLGQLFYKRNDIGNYIKFASLCAPISFVSAASFSILNGIGKQNILLRNSLIVSVEELILIYLLTGIRSINIYGCGISLILTSLTSLILNMHEIKKEGFYNPL